MKVYITVKSLGKRKNYLTKKVFEISIIPKTLKELIIEIVREQTNDYNTKKTELPLVNYLTNDEIIEQSISGKVGFSTRYNERDVKVDEAIDTAILAFGDGLYKVFINDGEIEGLDTSIALNEKDEIAFIKMTMLSGRLW